MTEPIAVIPKNARERIEVNLTQWKGHDLCEMHIHAFSPDGWRPTTKGLTIRLETLPNLVRAMSEAEGTARSLGLID